MCRNPHHVNPLLLTSEAGNWRFEDFSSFIAAKNGIHPPNTQIWAMTLWRRVWFWKSAAEYCFREIYWLETYFFKKVLLFSLASHVCEIGCCP